MIDKSLFKKKELYPFQKKVVNQIITELVKEGENFNLLFQLPTGGGKTVIFSNIAKDYIKKTNKKNLNTELNLVFLCSIMLLDKMRK